MNSHLLSTRWSGSILLVTLVMMGLTTIGSPVGAQSGSGPDAAPVRGWAWGGQLALARPAAGSASARSMLASFKLLGRAQHPIGPAERRLDFEAATGLEAHWGVYGDGVALVVPLRVGLLWSLATRERRIRPGIHAGVALNYHHWVSGIEGVRVRDQLAPGVQGGICLSGDLSARFGLDIRLEHVISFTRGLTMELAGMQVHDRRGYEHRYTAIALGFRIR